jgi:hypothetical protein
MLGKPRPVVEERDEGGTLAHSIRSARQSQANFTAAGLLADGAGARSGIRAPGSHYFLSPLWGTSAPRATQRMGNVPSV